MNIPSIWFRKHLSPGPRILSHRFPVEPLEPRIVLAVFNVSGMIANGTVWANGDIQRITSDATVPAGATLTIEPGAIIQFNAFAAIDLFIDGTVNANGTSGSGRILFTSVRDDTGRDGLAGTADDIDTEGNGATTSIVGEWNQIAVSATGTATFNNVDVRSGGDPFPGVTGSIATNGGALTLTNSTVSKSEVAGVRIAGANPTLTNNIFRDNLGAAVSMDLASNPAISAVTAANNGVNGLAVDAGTLSGSRFWDDPDIVYRLSGDVIVGAGATLTVAPGQIVKARAFAADDIIVNGTLNADGTAAQPIIFTTDRDDAAGGDTNNNGANVIIVGEWNGITFNDTSTANVLDRVEVRSAGDPFPGITAAVIVNAAPLTMTNSIIRDSEVNGVRIIGANPTLTNNTFAGNLGGAMSMDLASNPAISGVTVTNNGANALVVDGGTLTGSRVWDDPDIVYRLNGDVTIATGATLTIAPGLVVKARAFGADDIIVNGTLNADGTAAQPIIFTTDRDDAAGGDTNNNGANVIIVGEWNGITFNSTSAANLLDYVEIRSAGDPFPGITGAVIVNGAPLTMTNSVIRDSEVHGVRIVGANPTLTNTTFQGNLGAAVSMDLASNPAIIGVTATNNGANALVVDAGTLSGARVWDDTDIVYRLNGDVTIEAGASLTIAPGMVVKARAFGADDIIVNGTLNADGTPAQPIIFTTDRDDAAGGDTNNNGASVIIVGEWNGITFNNTSTANVLDHVEVRSAGDPFPGITAAVIVNGAPLTMTNSVIRDSEVHAVRIVGANPTLTNNTFQGNLGAAVSMDLASNPAITGVTVTNNGANALVVDAGTLTSSRVWDDTDIVYRLNGDLTVAAGATLTIAPGMVVKARAFGADDIIVSGTLVANGTAARPIIFTTDRDDTAGGDTNNNGPTVLNAGEWNGVRFDTGSTGNLLDHVEVRSAGDPFTGVFGAVVANGGSVTVTNSVISRSEIHALTARSGGTLMAGNNLIRDNLDAGIRADSGGQVTAFNNTIDGNFRGISVDGAGTAVTITNNLITNNTRTGVFVAAGGSVTVSFNDVFNPTAQVGNYEGLTNPTGTNGNISADPQYFNRANKQFQLRAGSPAIDSAASAGAPTTDFLGNPRFDDPNILNVGSGTQPFFDRGAIERQEISTSDVDLRALTVSGPLTGLQGQNVTVDWTVDNLGPAAILGSWFDAVYLSTDAVFTPDDIFLGDAQHTGDLGRGESYSNSKQVTLPGVLPGDYRLIVRANARNEIFEGVALVNNSVASTAPIAMDLPVLTLGLPLSGQLPQTGSALFYKINAPADADLGINLDGPNGPTNELYLRFGDLPSRQFFDERGNRPNSPDQSVSVADTQAGQYYAMVYGANLAAPESFTISATVAGFGITGVFPTRASNTGEVTVVISGAQFDVNSQPRLVDSANQTVTPTKTYFTDSGLLAATFDLAGRPLGPADVQVQNTGDVVTTLPDAVNIVAGQAGRLTTSLSAPGQARLGRDFVVTIQFTNAGDTDLLAPTLQLSATQGFAQLSLDADFHESATTLDLIAANSNGPAGVLPPGARGSITVYGRTIATGDERFDLKVGSYIGTIDYAALEPTLRPAGVPDAVWQPLFAQLQMQLGTTWDGYVRALSENATLLPAELGSPNSLHDVFGLEIDQAIAAQNTSVSGRLFRNDVEHPLGNARVILHNAAGDVAATGVSLNDGRFEVPIVPAGTYNVSIEGYVLTAPLQLVVSSTDVTAGNLVAVNAATLEGGVVLGGTGAPLAGVDVLAVDAAGATFNTTTDRTGVYRFDALPPGIYTVTAGGGTLTTSSVGGLDLALGEQLRHANLALEAGATITGKVTLPGGAAAAGARVSVSVNGVLGSTTLTDDAGNYQLTGLPAGEHQIRVDAEGFAEGLRQSTAVAAGATLGGQDLALNTGGGLQGRITFGAAGPGATLAFLVLSQNGQPRGAAQADVNGFYQLPTLAPGTYDFSVDADDALPLTGTITVTAGQVATRDVQVSPAGTLLGKVTAAGGAPLSGVQVVAVSGNVEVASAITGADGSYELDELLLGTYKVRLLAGAPGTALAEQSATLATGTESATRDFSVSAGGVIRGTVFGADGVTPAPGTTVFLSITGDVLLEGITDDLGRYSFSVLKPGTYSVTGGGPYGVRGNLVVQPGATLTGVDLLQSAATVQGTVTDSSGAPLANALLRFFRAGLPLDFASARDVFTAANGSYSVTDLAPTVYEVTVIANGRATVLETVDLTAAAAPAPLQGDIAAAAVPLTFSPALGPEAKITGTITEAGSGTPQDDAKVTVYRTSDNRLLGEFLPEPDGTFVAQGLTPGTPYFVTIGDGTHQQQSTALTPNSPSTVLNPVLPLSTTMVGGTVSSGPSPAEGVEVSAVDSAGRVRSTTVTNPNGTFTFLDLPPQEPFVLVADGTGHTMSPPVSVNPTAGQPVNVIMSVEPTAVTVDSDPLLPDTRPPTDDDRIVPPPQPVQEFLPPPLPAPHVGCEDIRDEVAERARILHNLWHGVELARSATTNSVTAADVGAGVAQAVVIATDLLSLFGPLAEAKDLAKGAVKSFHTNLYQTALNPFYAEALSKVRGDALKIISVDLPKDLKRLYEVTKALAKSELTANEIQKFTRDALKLGTNMLSAIALIKGPIDQIKTLTKFAGPFGRVLTILSVVENSVKLGLDVINAVQSSQSRGDALHNAEAIYERAVEQYKVSKAEYDACNERNRDVQGPVREPGIKPPKLNTSNSATQQIRTSFDPNDKHGPAGFGAGGFIQPGTMPFEVEFENDPVFAQIAAQIVEVKDTLHADLDLTTFEFRSFGFGNRVFTVPEGLTHYEITIDLRPEGIDLLVPVELDLNTATRLVTVTFSTLDPLTMLAPEGFEGFLPVNNANHDGEGFFTYVVQPKEGLATGTAITNQGSIVFDDNAPILTPTTVNTLDLEAPTSAVNALPATSNTLSIPVSWAGNDGSGSGVRTYDLFVSDNGGAFTLLLDDVPETSTLFTAQDGHTYGFFTVASDNVGFSEAPAAIPDATTTVQAATLAIAASDSFATEVKRGKPADPAVFTVTRTGDLSSPLTVPYTLTGTATSGTDYTALSGSATFAAGSATATVQVDPLDDKAKEGGESLVLTLQPITGFEIAGPASATVTIVDNDVATVTVSASDAIAAEAAARTKKDPGKFTFTRAGSTAKALVVDFTIAGTASDGVDFQELNGKVKFAPGSKKASVKITPTDDTILEGDEMVEIALAPSSKYNIGSASTAAVTIRDNETAGIAARTTLKQFDAGNYHPIGSGSIWDYNRNALAGLPMEHRLDKIILDVATVVASNTDKIRFERTPLFRHQQFQA